jgi:TPR repeat protein
VAQNNAEAARWYQRAADQGFAEAQYYLGSMYDEGQGVAQCYVKAVRWLKKAADQGVARAQFHMGIMVAKGRGMVKSDTEVMRWFLKAAEQGIAMAQYNVGFNYMNGIGIAKNYTEAAKWCKMALLTKGLMKRNTYSECYLRVVSVLRRATQRHFGGTRVQLVKGTRWHDRGLGCRRTNSAQIVI